jgi:acyl-coenzyme A thioesterase PaaI-like protein
MKRVYGDESTFLISARQVARTEFSLDNFITKRHITMFNGINISATHMRKLPSLSEDHTCFGAGPANNNGLRMKFYTDNERVYSELVIPEYMNSWQGLVHGGIVSTILDEIMFYTAMYFFKCIALTKEVTVKLHRPARLNQMPFTAIGEIKTSESDTSGVIAGKLYNSEGELCAESLGSFGLVKMNIIRRLEILTEKDICMIDDVIKKM